MKKLSFLAVAASLTLSACATSPMFTSSEGSGASAPPSGTQYCSKWNLSESGGMLNCTWVADPKAACTARTDKRLEIARYTSIAPAGRCETGEPLVRVSPKA